MGKVFVVSDRIRQLAKEKGWPDPDKEVEEFIDYYTTTGWKIKGGVPIVDREAAFRMWLRRNARWKAETKNGAANVKSAEPKGFKGIHEILTRKNKP